MTHPLITLALEEFDKKFETYNWEHGTEYEGKLKADFGEVCAFLSFKLLEIRNATIEEVKEKIIDLPEWRSGGFNGLKYAIEQALSSLQVKTE